MFAEDITLVCAVEGWRELTLELDIILHKSVFRFGFVWFQHILYMQFSHLGLPCARCGQNSAAPFPEPTVPCESLLAFLKKESTSLRGPQVHLEAGRARIQYGLIFKVAMLGEFSPQWGQHAISAEWRSHL